VYILGLTTLGDAAATLINDGEIVAAAEEERFSRIKHHSGFPYEAIRYCLKEAGIGIADIAHVGLYWKPWVLRHKAFQALRSGLISPSMFRARVDRGVRQIGDSYLGMFGYPGLIRKHFGPGHFRFHFLEHHRCHAASAFFASGFPRAAIVSWDGTGEDTTTLFSLGDDRDIRALKRIKLPHSLGQFYSAVTNFIGFDMFAGDEWKVMGLAAYGEPKYYDFFARRVLTLNGDNEFRLNIRVLDHHLAKRYRFSDEIVKELGPPRRADDELTKRDWDVAASAQKVLEDTALRLVNWLHRETGEENLCMAGGVAFNSVMNGLSTRRPSRGFLFNPPPGTPVARSEPRCLSNTRCSNSRAGSRWIMPIMGRDSRPKNAPTHCATRGWSLKL